MIAVAEMTGFEELAKLRVTWKQLWGQTGDASFFQSYDWLRSYWRMFGEGQSLKTLVVTLRTKPIGIIPLVVRPTATTLGTVNVLTWPLSDQGVFYGPVGPNPAAALTAAFRYLKNSSRNWNAIELGHLDANGRDAPRVVNAMKNCGLQGFESARLPIPVVELLGSWDLFVEQRTREQRMQFSWAEQMVSRCGPITFHRWRSEGGDTGGTLRRRDLFQTVCEFHRNSCGNSQGNTIELPLLEDVHPAAVDAGAVDICSLSVGDRPVACAYSYITNGTLEIVFMGADTRLDGDAKPLLLGYMIRDGFGRGDERILLRTEDSEAVRIWQTGSTIAVTYGHFPKLSPSAQMLRRQRARDAAIQPSAVPKPVEVTAAAEPVAYGSREQSPLRVYSGS